MFLRKSKYSISSFLYLFSEDIWNHIIQVSSAVVVCFRPTSSLHLSTLDYTVYLYLCIFAIVYFCICSWLRRPHSCLLPPAASLQLSTLDYPVAPNCSKHPKLFDNIQKISQKKYPRQKYSHSDRSPVCRHQKYVTDEWKPWPRWEKLGDFQNHPEVGLGEIDENRISPIGK